MTAVGLAAAEWAAPSLLLMLVPKCPMCVAAYVALFTGVGLSFTTAMYLRYALLSLCLAALVFVAVRSINRWFDATTHAETHAGDTPDLVADESRAGR